MKLFASRVIVTESIMLYDDDDDALEHMRANIIYISLVHTYDI